MKMRPHGIVLAAISAVAIAATAFVGFGIYNIGADAPHLHLTYVLLQTLRERSIAARAARIDVPVLEDAARIPRGAGNYDAMCKGCHLAPQMESSEMSIAMYPAPPNLSTLANIDAAKAFWVVKHGIKASGMPAWGKRVPDENIWDIVAFLRTLSSLTGEQYRSAVAASGGHSHGGGETRDEDHESMDAHDTEKNKGSMHETKTMGHTEPITAPFKNQRRQDAIQLTPVAIAKAFHEALASGDASQVKTLLDESVLVLESGNVERSRKEYAANHLAADLKFMKSLVYKLERQSGETLGDLAWVATEARLTDLSSEKAIDTLSTETLVLKKSAAGWKVVHIHWSSRSALKTT